MKSVNGLRSQALQLGVIRERVGPYPQEINEIGHACIGVQESEMIIGAQFPHAGQVISAIKSPRVREIIGEAIFTHRVSSLVGSGKNDIMCAQDTGQVQAAGSKQLPRFNIR